MPLLFQRLHWILRKALWHGGAARWCSYTHNSAAAISLGSVTMTYFKAELVCKISCVESVGFRQDHNLMKGATFLTGQVLLSFEHGPSPIEGPNDSIKITSR